MSDDRDLERGTAFVAADDASAAVPPDGLGHTATARASLGLYNRFSDVDALVDSIRRIQARFA